MKKNLSYLLIILILVIGLQSCSSNGKDLDSSKLNIGIIQYVEHPALDDARVGFIDRIEEKGIDANIHYQNAHGDISNTMKINQKFVSDKVDLIYAIGTPAAQSARQVTSEIPILFSAVTDPLDAGIVNSWDEVGTNVTGTSDKADVLEQLKMFREIDENIKTIGIIHNTSEQNSIIQVEEVKKLAPSLNLDVKVVGINNINDLNKGLKSLVKKVDAMYILSDNLTASAVDVVSNILIENNMISVCAEESQVNGGVLITKSHSYYDLGKQTGDIAIDVLINNKDISKMPVYLSDKQNLVINFNTLEQLDIDKDKEIFKNN